MKLWFDVGQKINVILSVWNTNTKLIKKIIECIMMTVKMNEVPIIFCADVFVTLSVQYRL